MRYSIIENGKVVNHAEADEGFAASQGWIAAGDSRIGDVWDGVKFSPPVIALSVLRAAKLAQVNEIKQAKLTGTIVVSGMTISLDADSKGLMALGKTNGARATRKIHTHSGDKSILTAAQFDGLVAAIEDFGQLAMDRAYDLSAQIDAATTVAELQAIDVTAGWPT